MPYFKFTLIPRWSQAQAGSLGAYQVSFSFASPKLQILFPQIPDTARLASQPLGIAFSRGAWVAQ